MVDALPVIDERAVWMAASMIRDEQMLAPHELAHAMLRRLHLNGYIDLPNGTDKADEAS